MYVLCRAIKLLELFFMQPLLPFFIFIIFIHNNNHKIIKRILNNKRYCMKRDYYYK